jgi:hypothetical protein
MINFLSLSLLATASYVQVVCYAVVFSCVRSLRSEAAGLVYAAPRHVLNVVRKTTKK